MNDTDRIGLIGVILIAAALSAWEWATALFLGGFVALGIAVYREWKDNRR
jgi:hypothetical protein